jgi:arsenate reductase-like glutaredoxin family protein
MAGSPRLIERPIVVSDRGAFVGRPVERVLEAI